jgi:hypothetical protein
MNWSDLAQKKIWAPFATRVTNEMDISNFCDEVSRMISADSPDAALANQGDMSMVRTNYLSNSTSLRDNSSQKFSQLLEQVLET